MRRARHSRPPASRERPEGMELTWGGSGYREASPLGRRVASMSAALLHAARDLEARRRVLAQSERVQHLVDEDVRGVADVPAPEGEAAVRAHEDRALADVRERVDAAPLARRLVDDRSGSRAARRTRGPLRPVAESRSASGRPDASRKSDRTTQAVSRPRACGTRPSRPFRKPARDHPPRGRERREEDRRGEELREVPHAPQRGARRSADLGELLANFWFSRPRG